MTAPVVSIVNIETRDKPRGQWVGSIRSRGGHYQRDETNVKTRVYVWPERESVIENFLVGRFTRPVALLRTALPEVFKQLSIGPYKARWSQKAGCSCGCSPAFILDARLGYDIFVTAKWEQPALTPEQEQRVASRVESWQMDPTLPSLV